MPDAAPSAPGPGRPSEGRRWLVFLVVECVALSAALLMPLTPAPGGGGWSPSEVIVAEPGYLMEVAGWFVAGNLLVALFGAGLLAGAGRVSEEMEPETGEEEDPGDAMRGSERT